MASELDEQTGIALSATKALQLSTWWVYFYSLKFDRLNSITKHLNLPLHSVALLLNFSSLATAHAQVRKEF